MKVLDRKVCYSFDDDPIAIPMVKISLGMNYRTGTEIIRWDKERAAQTGGLKISVLFY